MIPLSDETAMLLNTVIATNSRKRIADRMLMEISGNIPCCENCNPAEMERIRFSVLRLLAEGQMAEDDVFQLALTDWRDLLMACGHGSAEAHKEWARTAIRQAADHGNAPDTLK